MYEEIDLRPYFEVIIGVWKWILLITIGAAILTFIASSFVPPTYEATALVAITEDREIVQFDPRFETVDERPPSRAYPELAMSDGVLQTLLSEVQPIAPEIRTVSQLRSQLIASAGSDASIIRLTASFAEPELAALIANSWADLFIRLANELYGASTVDQLRFYQTQLAGAEEDLQNAEEALIEFQSENPSSLLGNRLTAFEEEQNTYLSRQSQLRMLTQDVESLRNRLASGSALGSTIADQITALSLQLKIFNAEATSQLQIQLPSPESLIGESTEEHIAYLDSLLNALEAQATQIDGRLMELAPQILQLQGERQKAAIQEERLNRQRDLVDESYRALARKVEEEQITSTRTANAARLASRAAIPAAPTGPRRLLLTAAVAALSMVLVISLLSIITWWRQSNDKQLRAN